MNVETPKLVAVSEGGSLDLICGVRFIGSQCQNYAAVPQGGDDGGRKWLMRRFLMTP